MKRGLGLVLLLLALAFVVSVVGVALLYFVVSPGPRVDARSTLVLRPGGEFRFASDIDSYVNWTLRHCLAEARLEWTAQRPADWNEPWPGWRRTRYEEKAVRHGRRPTYLRFARTPMPLHSAATTAI